MRAAVMARFAAARWGLLGGLHAWPRRLRAALLMAVAVAAAGAWWYSFGQPSASATSLVASGTIEAEEVSLAAETGGRITSVPAEEGQPVRAGELLAEVDSSLLAAQLRQADAAVGVARANLALLEAGARPEDVRQAEAARAQAVALRDAAAKAWENAKALRDEPQDLIAKIDSAAPQLDSAKARMDQVQQGAREADLQAARAAVAAARSQMVQAQALSQAQEKALTEMLEAAKARLTLVTRGPRVEDIQSAERALDQARNTLWATQIDRDGIKGNKRLPEYQGKAADARVAAAETAVQAAEIQLAKLKAGPTAEEVRIAEAAVRQAEAELEAKRATESPTLQAARAALDSAEARLRQLQAGATDEELRIAQAAQQQAERNLADLVALRDRPLALNAQVDAAQGQYLAAEEAVKAADARLEAVRNGPTEQQLVVAREQVRQAEAAREVLRVQMDKTKVMAPADGLVTEVFARAGEMASPGSRLVGVANLDTVKLTVYVPEDKVGRLSLGQPVEVAVDSYPGQAFAGEVVLIGSKAEFTPRNVQTQRERANTVFAVKVSIPNGEHKLKPGQPADVTFRW